MPDEITVDEPAEVSPGVVVRAPSRHDRRRIPEVVTRRLVEAYGERALDDAHRGFDIEYAGRRLEHRACRGIELRQTDGVDPMIVGYATTYGDAYDIWGGPPFGFRETVDPGAADKSVREQDDVYLFFDHDGFPMASTKNGSLRLESNARGLYTEASPDRSSPHNMEVITRIDQKILDSMSFAFEVTGQTWNDDYTERHITEVRLFDVSVVSYPANPATEVGLRSETPVRENRSGNLLLARAQLDLLRRSST